MSAGGRHRERDRYLPSVPLPAPARPGPLAPTRRLGGSLRWRAGAFAGGALPVLGRPVRPFLIVSPGRAGSELLVSLLDSNPAIGCDGEVLLVPRFDAQRLLRGRRVVARIKGWQAYGAKIISSQLTDVQRVDPNRFLRTLEQDGWQIIWLWRRNFLEQAMSYVHAARSGHLHHSAATSGGFAATTVDPMMILSLLWLYEDRHRLDREMLDGVAYTELVYEDDLADGADHQRTVDRLCALLGVPAHRVTTPLVKFQARSQRQSIANYAEVCSVLAGTRYAHFLSEAS